MAIGPGKYDKLTTKIMDKTGAVGCLLMVFEGEKGSGFSVQAPLEMQIQLPDILRSMAEQIEEDVKRELQS